jgi:hypothetical protein
MAVLKPLYGITEAGTYWWAMYSKHYKEKLLMDTSIYNPCLLITLTNNIFGVVGMQTDNTIILGDERFLTREEQELAQANYTAKLKEKLITATPFLFNNYIFSLDRTNINLRQKGQGNKLQIVDSGSSDYY